MMKSMFKVLSQTEAITVQKQDGSTIQKSTIVLQELGGRYEDSYVATLLGNQIQVYSGDVVFAALRFTSREYPSTSTAQARVYQDVTVQEIVRICTSHTVG